LGKVTTEQAADIGMKDGEGAWDSDIELLHVGKGKLWLVNVIMHPP